MWKEGREESDTITSIKALCLASLRRTCLLLWVSQSPCGKSEMSSTDVTTEYMQLTSVLQLDTSVCNMLRSYAPLSENEASDILSEQLPPLLPPYPFRLIELPYSYEELYHSIVGQKMCSNCQQIPTNPGICLLCGELVCVRTRCCTKHNMGESYQHAAVCGFGAGLILLAKLSGTNLPAHTHALTRVRRCRALNAV